MEHRNVLIEVRNLSRSQILSIMSENAGIVQKANSKPTDRRVSMYGCVIIWVPDHDNSTGFQQILIPDKQASRDIKEAAKVGKRKLFLELGFSEKEFETIYRIPKIPEKFSTCVLKPTINVLRHPECAKIMAALREFPDPTGTERDREKWFKKSFSIVRPTGIPGRFIGTLKTLIGAFDPKVTQEDKKPLTIDEAEQAKSSLATKFTTPMKQKKVAKVFDIQPAETRIQIDPDATMENTALTPPQCPAA